MAKNKAAKSKEFEFEDDGYLLASIEANKKGMYGILSVDVRSLDGGGGSLRSGKVTAQFAKIPGSASITMPMKAGEKAVVKIEGNVKVPKVSRMNRG